MKTVISVLRLVVLVSVLILLPIISKGPEAQLAHQCVTFSTETLNCPGCCTKSTNHFPNSIIVENQPTGIQSILETAWSCGSPGPGSCSTTTCSGTYEQAVSDSGCCIADGSACVSNEPCCSTGTTCSSGTCGSSAACPESCTPNYDINETSTAVDYCSYPATGCPSGYYDDGSGCCTFENTTPILIDTTGRGFFLTDAKGGVLFDIAGTGHPIQMGWTAPGADNAFLALPGADGLIHSGNQLFGNFTTQPSSATPNGFAALVVYDQPANGGNGDGVIDARDTVFAFLRLWIDANHDGVSQPEELHTLPSLGVNSISLSYKADQRTDQWGNVFHYRAQVNPGDATSAGRMAYDVFFVTVP